MIDLEEMRKENKRLEKLLEKVENGIESVIYYHFQL
jgi:tetrahydromethanopterin S-methyltransferase subunit G